MTNWKKYKLGDLLDVNAKSVSINNTFSEIEYLDTGSISNGVISGLQKYLFSEAPSRARRLIKKNDIVYSTVRPIQRHYGIIKKPKVNLVVSTGFAVLSTYENKAVPDYIYYFLTQDDIVKYLDSVAEGSTTTYPSITPNVLTDLEILLPPLPEQRAIASVLSSLDDKIELNRRQNETLEKIAQAIFRHWFVDFNFPNEKGKPYKDSGGEMVESEMGLIPKGWRIKSLKEIIDKLVDNRGKTPKYVENGIPAISAKFVKNGKLVNRESFNYIDFDLYNCSEKINVNDILLTTEAPLGELYYLAMNTNYYPSQRIISIRTNTEICKSQYLYYWLNSYLGKSLLTKRQSGSTVQGIKQSELLKAEIFLPPIEKQNEFELFVKEILIKKELNEIINDKLILIRDILLPKLMSGKVRVKGGNSD